MFFLLAEKVLCPQENFISLYVLLFFTVLAYVKKGLQVKYQNSSFITSICCIGEAMGSPDVHRDEHNGFSKAYFHLCSGSNGQVGCDGCRPPHIHIPGLVNECPSVISSCLVHV